jgi:hypothetical protein
MLMRTMHVLNSANEAILYIASQMLNARMIHVEAWREGEM